MSFYPKKFLFDCGKKILPILFLCVFTLSGCTKNEDEKPSGVDIFGLNDQTQEAAEIVASANEDLMKIRKMYKENQDKIEELKSAMNEKRIEDVKKIANDLVTIINSGFALGESAIEKLDKAETMNTNEKYKEYLQLKRASLQKQLDAFDFRRKFAIRLRDEFGTKDKFEIEKVKSDFRDFEENFQVYMEKARELSGEANQLAKDAVREEK